MKHTAIDVSSGPTLGNPVQWVSVTITIMITQMLLTSKTHG